MFNDLINFNYFIFNKLKSKNIRKKINYLIFIKSLIKFSEKNNINVINQHSIIQSQRFLFKIIYVFKIMGVNKKYLAPSFIFLIILGFLTTTNAEDVTT